MAADADALDDLLAAVEATGRFASVTYGTADDRPAIDSDSIPSARVLVGPWSEDDSQFAGPLVRSLDFTIVCTVAAVDGTEGFGALQDLEEAIRSGLNFQPLGDQAEASTTPTVVARTRLTSGSYSAGGLDARTPLGFAAVLPMSQRQPYWVVRLAGVVTTLQPRPSNPDSG